MSALNGSSELTSDQRECVDQLKRWAETEIEIKGRSDEDYILLFLRSCDFNLELSKTTFRMYYESRKKYPQWFSNRDVRNSQLQNVLQLKFITTLIETDVHQPSITILKSERLSGDSSHFDDIIKITGLALETVARRRSCQMNGNIIFMDFENCPWWLIRKLMWPSLCKALLNSLVFGLPVKTQALVLVNSPLVGKAILAICEPFFTPEFRKKVHLFSDWSKVDSVAPFERFPVEVGGSSGPMNIHEDAFVKEVARMNEDLIRDDEHFGFEFDRKSQGNR